MAVAVCYFKTTQLTIRLQSSSNMIQRVSSGTDQERVNRIWGRSISFTEGVNWGKPTGFEDYSRTDQLVL
jgi:hypothetical protein